MHSMFSVDILDVVLEVQLSAISAHASIDDSIRVDMVDNRKFWKFLFDPCTKQ